jgi:hypothetical protein
MVNKLNIGFRMFFSVAAIVTLAGVFMLSSCSSDKKDEVEVEETVETEAVMEAATPAPAPAPESDMEDTSSGTMETRPMTTPRIRVEGQVPPEIAEPCMAKNAGDSCTVIITGGRQIEGQCTETKSGQLACMPKAKPGKGARPQ